MADGPIQSRRAFIDTNSRPLDFGLAQTPLGPMVEPRPMLVSDPALGYRLDSSPIAYASRDILETDAMFPLYGTGGQQAPIDWTP